MPTHLTQILINGQTSRLHLHRSAFGGWRTSLTQIRIFPRFLCPHLPQCVTAWLHTLS